MPTAIRFLGLDAEKGFAVEDLMFEAILSLPQDMKAVLRIVEDPEPARVVRRVARMR